MPENLLLAALPPDDRARLDPLLKPVCLAQNEIVGYPGSSIPFVYFPQGCLGSIVVGSREGTSVEAALVGAEGVTAFPDVLIRGVAVHLASVQAPGSALRMGAGVFRDEFQRGGALQHVTVAYLQYLMVQMGQTTLCNRVHDISARLARWLLMTADGLQSEEMDLTQEFLSTMLGVHRPGVTGASHALKEAGAIEYSRGHITVTNRALLTSFSCECYPFLREQRDSFVREAGK